MAQIRVDRATLAEMLESHSETQLAAQVPEITDDELIRIRTLGTYYAWSDTALAFGGSMGGARALSLAALDVLEPSGRDLHRDHTDAEIKFGWSDSPDEDERARDRELRNHAVDEQLPDQES